MQAKRAGRRLSGNTVPAATRAAQSVCVCIEPPPRDFKTGCQLLLSYYPLPAPWAAPTSSQKLCVMLSSERERKHKQYATDQAQKRPCASWLFLVQRDLANQGRTLTLQ